MIDVLKMILKSNRYTYLIGKGLLSVKRYGIKYTWYKTLQFLKRKNNSLEKTNYKEALKHNKIK